MKVDEVQLLRKDQDTGRSQLMKEKIGTRTISLMEVCLSLCGEGVVYSTFYLRELWIVLPDEKRGLSKRSSEKRGS